MSLSVGSAATATVAGSTTAKIANPVTRIGPRVIIAKPPCGDSSEEPCTCKAAAIRARWHIVRSPPSSSTTSRRRMSHGEGAGGEGERSEEHTSELQSRSDLVCRLLLEKKK